ncbi:unnamed protein product [Amaranthus hypochondriacus]
MTPYEVVYNQPAPIHLPYLAGESRNEAADRSLQKRELMIESLKFHIHRAQVRMKHQADKKRSERVFDTGDWVWLKLHPYRQHSVQARNNQKLAYKFYGPFQICEKIGKVAYKLRLPVDSRIHNVFHVSLLKKFHGTLPLTTVTPLDIQDQSNEPSFKPTTIKDRRIVKHNNQAVVQYLVQWEGLGSHESSWEDAILFEQKYPDFNTSST